MRFGMLFLLVCAAQAQWLDYKTPGVPRTKDGKPNLSAPVPRAPDGRPDLSGVWMHGITTVEEVRRLFGTAKDNDIKLGPPGMEVGTQHKYAFNILLDFKPGEEPLRPEVAEAVRRKGRDPLSVCTSVLGIPVAALLSEPIKIIQAPKVTMLLYEVDNQHRQIFTDGRTLPKEFNLPAYLGYSVGRWERDTFVVETAGFNDKTILDTMGRPHSESLHVTERFHRRDYGHLDIEMTFDDPPVYSRPFTIKVPFELQPDTDLFEMNCNENEKDREHIRNAASSSR